ncbi:hypothetical protein DR864_29350 (plasmid) [Runella rosea]|uniref:T9SS type A sorting domain-containing protein n=1 Tax=Runella rosea TaxID=2259595 RepID=A0A344TTK2_9BACT|nr:cellulase family glycosylhydrolase [Runella rosea]AXE21973.1 hypothetical protein DR864_29350 [Runella rosea]
MKKVLYSTLTKLFLHNLILLGIFLSHLGLSQSVPLPTDRARITVASIPDYYGGPNLKVLRTDAGTPLRAGTAWIWEKGNQEEPASYYASMTQKGLNAVRMILFDTWEVEAYQPSAQFTPTDWNDPVYRARQLARMERSVNYASAQGMYVIINSHNKIPEYNETYANALWTYVAPYFANRTHVIYEASNEPMPGIGINGDMDMGTAGAVSSPRLQALKRTFNIIRAGAPNTHIMVLTPNGISDYGYGTGVGNLAASFAQLPGNVDWTKTSVAYHLYHNDGAAAASINAANLRNLHSRYPGWPSENNFPASVSNATLGITDSFRSPQFDNDIYVNQTCERLGLGWSMWNINGQAELDRNWPVMYADAVAKGWNWIPDPTTPDTQAPTVPTALVASNIAANSLTLSWTASTDNIAVTNYEIFRDGTSIGTTATATTTFNVAGLFCATNATFTVKAKDAAGNTSAAGNALSVTTGNCPTSFVVEAETNYTTVSDVGSNCTVGPSNYAATTTSNGLAVGLCDTGDELKIAVNVFVSGNYDIQVRVRSGWTGSPMHFINNNKYEYRLNDLLRTFTYVPGSVTSTIDVDSYYATVKLSGTPLTAGVHYIRVKALENWAKVDYVRLDLITDTQAPTIPNNLSLSAITGSSFTLSWSASTDNVGVTGYEVFRNGISLGTTATASYSITGLSCGTNSAMTVRARDAVGNWSASSDILNVSTAPLPNAGTISGTTTICAGATTSLTTNGLAGGTWSSSNTAVATVNTSGVVSGVAAGTATIIYAVSSNGCNSSSTTTVTVNALPNAGTISGTTTICAGATTSLISNGLAGGTWSSSNTAVATVNTSGVVSCVAAGTATITYVVSSNSCNSSTSTTVTVNALPNAGTISGTTTINTGATTTLVSNGAIGGSWSSNNTSVATVNTSGTVTGVAAGTSTITYTVISNGCTRSTTTNVTVNTPIISTSIVVRARSVNNAGASFRVEIMNGSAATGGTILQNSNTFSNLSKGFVNYTFTATGTVNPNQIRVRYLNDMAPYDFEADYIQVNGTTYQTEAASTYSVGFWNSANGCNNAGFLGNSLIHCDGYFHYLATPTSTPIIVRARSVNSAGASFRIEIMNGSAATGGTVAQSSNDFTNLSTNFADYTFNATGSVNPNRIRIRYLNDMTAYDFEADYIQVNGTTYQTEAASTFSVGFWNAANGCNNAGFLANSLIHCSGYFHFLANSGARLSAESLEIEPITAFGVYPNPAKYLLNVILYTTAEQQVELRIMDLNGTVLSSFSKQVKAGKNTVNIPINQFNEGTFVISAEYDNRRSTAKFSVIR